MLAYTGTGEGYLARRRIKTTVRSKITDQCNRTSGYITWKTVWEYDLQHGEIEATKVTDVHAGRSGGPSGRTSGS